MVKRTKIQIIKELRLYKNYRNFVSNSVVCNGCFLRTLQYIENRLTEEVKQDE